MAKTNGTSVYTRQHRHGLTLAQQSAIDLLVTGKNDTETAQLLGCRGPASPNGGCTPPPSRQP
jgi:hypothetical protein